MLRESLGQIGFGVRRLARTPGYTLTCVLTLALGIGAAVTIFSVVQGVLLEPLPFEDPDRLVSLQHVAPAITPGPVTLAEAIVVTYFEESRELEAVGAWRPRQAVVTGLDSPERVRALEVNHQLLTMLGGRADVGRLFQALDDQPGSPACVVVSHGYLNWMQMATS